MERLGDSDQRIERSGFHSTLQSADVNRVEVRLLREFFLRQCAEFSVNSQVARKESAVFRPG